MIYKKAFYGCEKKREGFCEAFRDNHLDDHHRSFILPTFVIFLSEHYLILGDKYFFLSGKLKLNDKKNDEIQDFSNPNSPNSLLNSLMLVIPFFKFNDFLDDRHLYRVENSQH